MAVVANDPHLALMFTADELLDHNPDVILAIAKALLKRQAQAAIDIAIDEQVDEPITHRALTDSMREVKAMTRDCIECIFQDIQVEVDSMLAHNLLFGAAVTEMKFSLAGDVIDATVDVSFTEREVGPIV